MRIGAIILFVFSSALIHSQKITIETEVRMLALGDSYTIGESVEASERWPHQFMTMLRDMGVTAEDPDYIATTGWRTDNLLDAMETVLNTEKDYNLVSILIGVNNQYQGVDINSYGPDLREIITKALNIVEQDIRKAFMLSIPDYAYTPFGSGNTAISSGIDRYNDINRRIAREYGIPYIDITEISRLGLDQPGLVADDGLHPSGSQYGMWVAEIKGYLELPDLTAKRSYKNRQTLQFTGASTGSTINIINGSKLDHIRIWSSNGILIKDLPVTETPVSIDLKSYPPGMYLVEARSDIQRITGKIILE